MASTALIVGGTGLVGRALASLLSRDGWDVTVASRGIGATPVAEVKHVRLDRNEDDTLKNVAGRGFDVLFDVVAMRSHAANQLVEVGRDVGSIVVVSTSAVYADSSR